jgi:hypothetical protein
MNNGVRRGFEMSPGMEEPGKQCTAVFALIVTEPASECVCVCG